MNKTQFNNLLNQAEVIAEKANIKAKFLSLGNESEVACWRRNIEKSAYNTYLNSSCFSKDDLFKIAGLVYSWMPTMLELYYEEDYDFDELIKQINNLGNIDEMAVKKVIMELTKIVNHSVVGVSKLLHIIYPTSFPIIDSRVASGWNKYFKVEITNSEIAAISTSWYWKTETKLSYKVENYMKYKNYLSSWSKNLGLSIRDIEVLFYLIGEPEKKEKEKKNSN
jgi:hypothetical protein